MTPRLRTVTSGLRSGSRLGVVPVLVEQEVEAPHLVRAVVRAVARADAAVVDHVVQAFRAVRRGADRADELAGRVLALLARHRLVVPSRSSSRPRACPRSSGRRGSSASRGRVSTCSLPTTGMLFSATGRRSCTRRSRCRTSGRSTCPTCSAASSPTRGSSSASSAGASRPASSMTSGSLPVLLDGRDAHRRAAFHQVVFLRPRDHEAVADLRDLEPAAEPQRVGGAQLVDVEFAAPPRRPTCPRAR